MVNVSLRHTPPRSGRSHSGTEPAARNARRGKARFRMPSKLLLVLLGLVATSALIALAVAALRQQISPPSRTGDQLPIELTLSGARLVVPADLIRFESARHSGKVDRIDLAMAWPSLEAMSPAAAEDFRRRSVPLPLLFVTLRPGDEFGDSTSRLDGVYTRFFSDEAWTGPGGLVGVKLDDKSGYAGEDLFFQPESEHPFVARCLSTQQSGVPPTCLRDIRTPTGLSILYRFDRSLLEDWQSLDPALLKRVEGFQDR